MACPDLAHAVVRGFLRERTADLALVHEFERADCVSAQLDALGAITRNCFAWTHVLAVHVGTLLVRTLHNSRSCDVTCSAADVIGMIARSKETAALLHGAGAVDALASAIRRALDGSKSHADAVGANNGPADAIEDMRGDDWLLVCHSCFDALHGFIVEREHVIWKKNVAAACIEMEKNIAMVEV